jgi:hypothetical protein
MCKLRWRRRATQVLGVKRVYEKLCWCFVLELENAKSLLSDYSRYLYIPVFTISFFSSYVGQKGEKKGGRPLLVTTFRGYIQGQSLGLWARLSSLLAHSHRDPRLVLGPQLVNIKKPQLQLPLPAGQSFGVPLAIRSLAYLCNLVGSTRTPASRMCQDRLSLVGPFLPPPHLPSASILPLRYEGF